MPTSAQNPPLAAPTLPPRGSAEESRVVTPDGSAISLNALSQIERLDDVVFDALAGDPEALNLSAVLWRKSQDTAPKQLLEEARQHYLRQAKAVFNESQDDPANQLGRTFAALEILMLLAD